MSCTAAMSASQAARTRGIAPPFTAAPPNHSRLATQLSSRASRSLATCLAGEFTQSLQRSQVGARKVVIIHRRLEDEWLFSKRRVRENPPEPIFSNPAFADVLVTVE